ncbi:MAG: hypothetical protein ACJ72Z_03730 [Pyrinomonadaceae bacterium]
MFCPNCSEPKTKDATQFCKRCGLDLFGLSEFVESGEKFNGRPIRKISPKAVRQSISLFAFGLMLIPVWMYVSVIYPPENRPVESAQSTTPAEMVAWILMWMAFIASALRVAYALFENRRCARFNPPNTGSVPGSGGALPSGDYFRPADPGAWNSTNELFEPIKRRTTGEL